MVWDKIKIKILNWSFSALWFLNIGTKYSVDQKYILELHSANQEYQMISYAVVFPNLSNIYCFLPT